MTFKEFLLAESTVAERRLSVYECPYCGGEAYNGVPGSGYTFRGSLKCSKCNESYAGIGQKRISENGPLIGNPPKEMSDMSRRLDAWLARHRTN